MTLILYILASIGIIIGFFRSRKQLRPVEVLFSTGFEGLSTILGVLTYKGWNLFYSAIFYVLIFLSELLFLRWVIGLSKNNKSGFFLN